MLKKRVKYTDFNGVSREKDLYFNLTKSELVELEMGKDGGMTGFIDKIVNTDNRPELINLFKEFILLTYGEKSADGESFIKGKAITEAFSYTAAFDALFMELSTDANAASAFFNGVIPAALLAEMQAEKNN